MEESLSPALLAFLDICNRRLTNILTYNNFVYILWKIISYLEESWAAMTLLGTYESNSDLGSDEITWFCSGSSSSSCDETLSVSDLKSCGGIWGGTKSVFGSSGSSCYDINIYLRIAKEIVTNFICSIARITNLDVILSHALTALLSQTLIRQLVGSCYRGLQLFKRGNVPRAALQRIVLVVVRRMNVNVTINWRGLHINCCRLSVY